MWKSILKARGLIDPQKLKQAMGLDKNGLWRNPQFAGLGKRIPKEGRYSDDGEYADVTANRILDIEFEKRDIRVKGDITVDGETIPFTASVRLPKPLAAMSKLPYDFRMFHVHSMEFRNNMPKEFLSEENDNFQDGIENYIGEELADYFNSFFRYYEEDMDYEDKDFFRTSQGLRSGREDDYGDVRYDRRSKQDSFKDVLRKPDSSNVGEFKEVMSSDDHYTTALPVDKDGAPNKALKRLIEKGIVIEKEKPTEEYKYYVSEQNRKKVINGLPIHLYFSESMYGGGEEHFLEIEDNLGDYLLHFYAALDIFNESKNQYSSRERQEIIDAAKKFRKMSGKQILDEILRM